MQTEEQIRLVTLHMVSRPVASRAELTCTSYTVSNEERSLSPVGGAITADYWVDPSHPDTFGTLVGCHSIRTQRWRLFFTASTLLWSICNGCTRYCFYPKPFAWEPVQYSVFKVLHASSFWSGQKRSFKGSSRNRHTTAVQTA